MENNKRNTKSKRYFKPARNKKENESKTSYFFNDSKSIGASLNDQSTESQWQPNQTNPKPKDSEKRPQKIQVLDLCEIVSLLEKTPEEIVLEMSNPKFSFDSYINDPMSIYSVNDNYIQKLLFLVGKALTCNSLKLKLGRLMTSFIESDFFTKLVYKQLESNETAVSNAALAPPTRRITGIFAPMEPESPPKELYSEMFVKSVMNVCAQIIDLDPYLKTSLDPFLDRLELIVKYKSNNYSLMEVYENILITSILKAMRKVELEKYRIFKDIEKYDPPEDFTELSIIPTLEEILSDQMPFLRKNVVSGAYQSVNHYLDVHFRLLREDFIQPLREGIIRFREIVNEAKSNRLDATMVRKLKQIDSLNVYMNVTIVSSVLSENGVVYMIKLNLKNNKLINWQNSKRLIYGSLVCLSSDYFTNECFIGIVCVRDVEMLKNAGEIMVKFDFNEFGGNLERLPKFDRSYSMLETSAYFESYRHVLRALQAFGHQNDCDFPFYDELVFMSSEVANESKAPYYLKNSRVDFRPLVDRSNNQPMIEGASGSLLEETWSMKNYDDFKYESLLYAKMCFFNNPDTWPSREQMNLDCSQYEAFKHALQNKLAVIQGPPGTGKTFIGVKLVQFLIQNSQLWWKKDKSRPILMICYTNHALDQFLESCIKMCGLNTGVVRVGGRCKNPSLEKFLLSNLRAQFRQERAYDWRMHTQMNECKQELNNMMELIESKIYQLESLSTLKTSQILKFEYLSSAMDLRQTDELYKKSEEKSSSNNESPDSVLLRWLGFFDITNGSFMNNKPNPATQNNPQTTDQYASIISRLFEERENNKNNRNKKQSDEKDENEEDEEEEEAENEERILEAFDSNKAIKAKLEANKNKKKDNSDKMFLSKFDIVKMFSQFNKGDNNNNDYKKVENNNQKYNKEMKFVESYLKSLLVQTEPFSELDVQGIIRSGLSIWQLNFTDRFRLYQYWLAKYESQILGVLKTLNREFNQQANIMLELRMQMDKSIMEKAMIIAMTTTGSSRYNEILKDIGPRIVIVEEAAEVFESHIVSSLSKHCQHLILIGDHVQLRPKPTVYKLATQFSLDVSLFERLVRNGFKSVMLDCQHRMRPQISMLAKLFYNHPIYDHELVEEYPNVVGMKKNVFFINHKEPESELLDLKSKRNRFEASFLGKLCQYLLKQDYEPSQITVITMYLGQLIEIRNELRRIGISKIRVSTVDNFQGEESDIVLLSLVRSNLRRRIGFLNTSNRICVALSRAKHGLYCIGNLDMLAEANFEWSEVLRTAQRNNLLGSELVLTCGQHPQNDIYVQRPLDFERRPDGGCQLMCGSRLRCGHMCQLHCHAVDRDHVKYKCTKPCSKIIPWCGHYCQQQCSHPGECSECTFLVKKTVRLCGHEIDFRCDREPERWDCQAQCERRVESCGHRCQRKCSDLDCDKCLVEVSYDPICVHKQQKIKTYCYEPFWVVQEKCTKTCGQELHACGHICSSTCGSCFGGRIHQGCREKCNRILFCGHKCRTPCAQQCRPCTAACENRCSHSKCVLKCWQPCAPCLEPCSWKCEHKRCTRLCHEECNREPCDMPCSKRLKCGHQCVGFCGEPCPKLCRVCHSDQLCEIFFGSEEQPDARFVVLEDCGHILEADGMLNWLKSHQKSGLIQLPDCPKCKTPMRKNKRFSAYIKHQMKAIDLIKRKHIADKEKIIEIRDELENDLNLIRSRKRQFKSDEWLKILTDIHETIVKRQESSFAQNDLIGLRNSFKLSMRLREQRSEALDYFTGITARTFLSHVVYEVDKIRPILGVTDMGAMTSDKAEEIWLEVQRIDNLINYYKYRYTFENKPDSWKLGHGDEIKALLDELVQKLIRSNHGYQNNVRVREIFTRLSKIVDLIISDSLRIAIVKAIGVKKGAWFRCPNGHPYCIDRCGGAMQLAYCADCKAPIGGAEHQLLDSNRFAGDFDNSQYPAYSDIANQMENFNINDI